MTQSERERAILKAYISFIANDWQFNKKPCSEQFIESDHYKSIPDAEDGWISAKDRLPELGESVLCYTEFGTQRGFRRIGGWSFSNGATSLELEYWQPLPSAPKTVKP